MGHSGPRWRPPPIMIHGGCESSPWVTLRRAALGLVPETIPQFRPADIECSQGCDRGRAVFDPAHARTFQSFADDLAACLSGSAADVPAPRAVARGMGARTVVLEIRDTLANFLS